jgi:hypothetical protein
MPMSPAIFFAGVSGLIRIGQAAQEAYRSNLRDRPIELFVPPEFIKTREQLLSMAFVDIFEHHKDLCAPSCRFEGLFANLGGRPVPAAGAEPMFEDVLAFYKTKHWSREPEDAKRFGDIDLKVSPLLVLTHKEWLDPNQRSPWAKLGLDLAHVAVDFIAAQPEILGLSRRTTEIVGALAPNLSALLADDPGANEGAQGRGSRLVKLFFRASLETIAERPELFVSEDRWKPVVAGIVVPFKEYIEAEPSPGREFLAHERLRETIRGPIAHAVLTAVSAEADSFLTGRFGGDQALGAVARCVLGAVATSDQKDFDLRRVFSEEGAAMIFRSALDVAEKQPDLFVKGIGLEGDAGRQFLRLIAGSIRNGPAPFDFRSGLAPQIASLSIQVAGDYVAARLRADAGDGVWASVGTDVATNIIGQIVQGFQEGVGGRRNAFARVFQLEQASDVLRIIATHVAENPAMLLGDEANSEVSRIAKGVASLIAHQTSGRLTGEDWRAVVSTTLQLAAANPGALFGVADDDRPESDVAVVLVTTVLEVVGRNVGERRASGGILFGRTLRDAITATLSAASSNLFLPTDFVADEEGRSRFDLHVEALKKFVTELLGHAAGDNRDLRMSASEWLYVYRHFIAQVLAKGPDADVSEQRIFEVLQSLDANASTDEVVG